MYVDGKLVHYKALDCEIRKVSLLSNIYCLDFRARNIFNGSFHLAMRNLLQFDLHYKRKFH